MNRRALLILGMHRTGTSALARVVSLRGAALPARVLPANEGNTRGYWEPAGVVELNDRILDYHGLAWDEPFAAMQLPALDACPAFFKAEAREVIKREYGTSPLFVIKDPRCTLLQDFWVEALASLEVEVASVVMVRPCDEVAASLVRRDGTSAETASLLYCAYGLAGARASQRAATFVSYEGLVDDWQGCTDRIAAEQGFRWPDPGGDVGAAVGAFMHSATPRTPALELPAPLDMWVDGIWAWNRDAAAGLAPPLQALDPIGGEFARYARVFAPALRDRVERLRIVDARGESMHRQRDQALQVYADTQQRLIETQKAYQTLETDSRAELDRAQADYAALEAAAKAELQQVKADYAALEATSEAELGQAKSDFSKLEAESGALFDTYQRTHEELLNTQGDYRQREADLGEARDMLGHAYREIADLQQHLDRITGSRSWKVTRPLRAVVRLLRGEPMRGGDGAGRTGLMPGYLAATPASMPDPPSAPAQAPVRATSSPAPAGTTRQHASLRAYLTEEFGEQSAADVILRIDRFRLPMPGQEVRGASRVDVDVATARDWAKSIARRYEQRPRPADELDVSIVIPVYNQLPFTLACLDALAAHQSRFDFEILIGDDASTDATNEVLSSPMPGVRHVRHEDNLGFVRNCNATAAHARGRHVLFLNNDTLVLPGWLDALVETLDSDPSIGLVGSKLIYPDGSLQECGAIVWKDGSAWNYGRLADPRRPEYSYRRDVDYVSGASIALTHALWRQLGGFDERYVPAYAEDADLAFRVREMGLRTVVQPVSQLLHFEGISSGTDLGSGAKAYQVENLAKLHRRWEGQLAGHRENADNPELEKERDVSRRVLFIDHCTPTPQEDAGSIVAMEVMRGFIEKGYKVTFIPEDNFAHMGVATHALQRLGIEAIYHPAYSRMDAFLAERKDPFDVIFLHRFGVGDAHMASLRRRFPKARILFLNADLHHLREMREAELSGDGKAMKAALSTRDRELAVISQADVTLVHSDFECDLLRRELPGADVVLFPLIHDPIEQVPALQGRSGICFVGGFRHPPNADGIEWFVNEAWPLVLAAEPGATLHVVGSHVTERVRALADAPGVEIVGFVEDLDAYLGERRMSIAPLRYGAGAKGKVSASMALGVPVVCTSVAAEGMQLEPGQDVLVGDSPEALANHVVALLRDDASWHALSQAGLGYARRFTSRAKARERLDAILGG